MSEPLRCRWCGDDPRYLAYHDHEWGVPCHDEGRLFEMLILEGAQAGLAWITILRKREGYRRAFDGFDPGLMARYDEGRIATLLSDPGIVRNRLKVRSAVTNARALLDLQDRGQTLDQLLWGFVDGVPRQNAWTDQALLPARTPESDAMSKALKALGFTFVGSTICYALMQSVGLVNDHTLGCFRHPQLGGAGAGDAGVVGSAKSHGGGVSGAAWTGRSMT
jgi:DNA-3-methyladenine glycosylase I